MVDRLGTLGLRFSVWVSSLWIRPSVLPEAPVSVIGSGRAKVCYVLENGGIADRVALEQVCQRNNLPLPKAGLEFAGLNERSAIIRLRRYRGFFVRTQIADVSPRLMRLSEAGRSDHEDELIFIPVAIYWGRSPDKERGVFKLAFSERWELVGRTRRLLSTFIHGRNTLVQFSEPLAFADILKEGLPPERCARKVSRILRVHFRQRRIATLGPDLSHRRTLVDRVLLDAAVVKAIDNRGKQNAKARAEAHKAARRYALEIAADCSYPSIRILERMLARVWNRLYDGIRLSGVDRLRSVVDGNEIVYVPCHRSHMDYLLLSYIIYNEGLSVPHIAAGINLNLPVVGSILRRGGAFFLRRSFKGNRLYAEVFHAYLRELQSGGFALEYFIEGGRSRTGRLLEPKGGMLSMTVMSHVANPVRPLYFIPVYLGYEKMIEGRSFVSELAGDEKQKETLFALLRSLKKLREDFGQVYVNFGKPLALAEMLNQHSEDWSKSAASDTSEDRPPWLPELVDDLGATIMRQINASAVVTPIGLIATALLGTPRQTMPLEDLKRQIEFFLALLDEQPFSEFIVTPKEGVTEMIAHAQKLGVIKSEAHVMGDLIYMLERDAVLMTYFRNNIMHLFAIHSSVACAFINGQAINRSELVRLVDLSYPYVAAELTMPPRDDSFESRVNDSVTFLIRHGLLVQGADPETIEVPAGGTAGAFQLNVLSQVLSPVLQRYYLTIALLVRFGQGRIRASALERACELCAQRLTISYGLRSPDFFDRKLFQLFIRGLQEQNIVWRDDDRRLHFNEKLELVQIDARRMLGEQIHHSILSVAATDHLSLIEPDAAAADS